MTITPQSKTTLGIAGTIVIAAIGSTWTISNAIGAVKAEIATRIDGVEASVHETKVAIDGKASLSALSEQALRMAIENPGLRVPDPRDPNRIIVVEIVRVAPPSGEITP